MSAVGLSILFIATIIGTLASRAYLMDSTVCSMTPSSTATTKTTISVAMAPLSRIAEKAACPGVSRNVMRSLPGSFTVKAPMCCVMPPNSWSTTLVLRSESKSVVFPWSTCPMIVMTGARGTSTLGSGGGLLTAS
uniref:Putative secreted protein ovary overexpressed n=1 Tax=Rhipicephalus microplus TaxID=6941 RepID=A0A6M2CXY5_RHIMP